MAGTPLTVLHITDDVRDPCLVQAYLRRADLDCRVIVVETEADARSWLTHGDVDVVLVDPCRMRTGGHRLLPLARRARPDIPLIVVSPALDEAAAERTLNDGAVDCIPTTELWRLGPAVRRAVAAAADRGRRREAETAVAALQEQLRHSQKMEAVGELASGIAHDFNNLLTVINGYCDRLAGALDGNSRLRADLDLIHKAGQRAAGLTRQLLAFGRRQARDPRPLDLNDVVRDIERLLVRVIGERTTVLTNLDPTLGASIADPGQVEQVLLNLAINARDAMPDGGTITIETGNVDVPAAGHPIWTNLPRGRYVQLALRDTGHGMDADTAARIFEPFFTTKGPGKGTGLGLSTVSTIVAQSGGHMVVDTRPGAGTTMRVFLPRVEVAGPRLAPPPVAAALPPGHETVLVVEDEEFVRELVREFLEQAGYTVLEAASAEDALRLVNDTRPDIDLLLTDVVLPGLDGPALASRLAAARPQLASLFMSGYPGDAMFSGAGFDPGDAFLAKPFTRQALTGKVRELLQRRPPQPDGALAAACP